MLRVKGREQVQREGRGASVVVYALCYFAIDG